MVDVEQALGRLPGDPAFAAEPLPAIEARAARRRRHRWQGRGAALVTAAVLALVGVAALTSPSRPQVVDTAAGGSRSQAGGPAPAVGAARPTVVAEGDVGGGHWRLLASRTDKGLCLDVELGGQVSSHCEPVTAVGPDRSITGAASTGLGQAFASGLIRKDVAGVRVEVDGTDALDLAPAGADKGFDVNFYITPLPPNAHARKAVALDASGVPVGEVGFAADPPAGPDDAVTTPTTSTDNRPVDTTRPDDSQPGDDGSQSSPPLPAPTDPVVPTTVDPSLGLCTAGQVTTTVTTEKATYAVGEAVHGTATIRNHSGTPCLLPTRAFFQIEDSAGRVVSNFAYTADYRFPTRAEPGQSFASTVTWDQQSCSMPVCSPAPPGTYVAAAEWTEGARFSAQGSFEIAG